MVFLREYFESVVAVAHMVGNVLQSDNEVSDVKRVLLVVEASYPPLQQQGLVINLGHVQDECSNIVGSGAQLILVCKGVRWIEL